MGIVHYISENVNLKIAELTQVEVELKFAAMIAVEQSKDDVVDMEVCGVTHAISGRVKKGSKRRTYVPEVLLLHECFPNHYIKPFKCRQGYMLKHPAGRWRPRILQS